MNKRYGEFECTVCGSIFHDIKKLQGHMGGAHRRNITEKGIIRCKVCNQRLVEGSNWPQWAVKQRNLICKPCKNIQNKKSYRNRIAIRINPLKSKLPSNLTIDDIKRRINRNG